MIQVFGCPLSYGANDDGLKKSLAYLQQHFNFDLTVLPEITQQDDDYPQLKHLNSIVATCKQIAEHSYHEILQKHDFPLFVGGDHAASMGTVSAAATYFQEVGLIWVDAHSDINTDETTFTGNIHGMPVAALLGMGDQRLTHFLNDSPKIKPENLVYIGLRDVDEPEKEFLKKMNIKAFSYSELKEKGFDACLSEAVHYLSHLKHVHVSFDIDGVNPNILPGVSVPVEDGFTIEEIYHVLRTLLNELPVSSMDVVEYNHLHDVNDVTAKFAVDVVEFIKRTLQTKK